MTDSQLIDLIQHAAPEELKPDDIAQIRLRLTESPELRAAVAHRLEMERYLSDAIGGADVNVSADRIMERARYAPVLRENRWLSGLGWALCLTLVGFVAAVLSLAYFSPPPHEGRIRQLADAATLPTGNSRPSSKPELDPSAKKEKRDVPKRAAKTTQTIDADREKIELSITGKPPKSVRAPVAPTVSDGDKVDVPQASEQSSEPPAQERQPWDLEPNVNGASQTVFANLNAQVPAPNHTELKRWLAPVAGQNINIAERDVYGMRCALFDGLGKLQAPLKQHTALRLSLFEHHHLQIHCFSGQQGVTFTFSEQGTPSWAAYRAARKGSEPKPERIELLSTDEDRYWRTGPTPPATFELRYADGLLTLSRGRIRLLDAPVAAMPEDVFIEGHAIFREIQVVPAGELMAPAKVTEYADHRPAEGKWKGELVPGADFKKLDDGSVELVAEKTKERPWVALALEHSAPAEIVLQLDSAQPGTGVYLGDEQGTPRYQLGFLKDQRTGSLMLAPLAVGDQRVEHYLDVNQMPQPFPVAKPWLKLISGCGTLKCWLSDDGVHWSRPCDPNNNYQGPVETVGIFCQPGDPKRAIRLSKLVVRELPAMSKLASDAARTKAASLSTAGDLNAWRERMKAARPAEIDLGDWRRASALETLARGTSAQLGMPLLTALIEETLGSDRKAAEKLAFLDEAMQLANVLDDPGQALKFARYYEEVGRQAYSGGERLPFSLIAEAQVTAPIWCRGTYNFTPEELLRTELLELVYGSEWKQAAQLVQQWRFYRRPPMGQQPQPGLMEWALSLASKELPRDAIGEQMPQLNDWRHPLIIELSKEGFNVLAELEAALDGKLYKEACQIIASAAANQALGLLPDSHDPQLMTSLTGAVSLAMRDHPELQQTMREQFGPIGALRVRQAIADSDTATIDAATLQFFGTPAAAEAHLWLGDRALATGAFTQSLVHYRKARATAVEALQNRIAAGMQIAGAATGQIIDAPISDAVQFGETKLTPGDLATLVAELRKQNSSKAGVQSSNAQINLSLAKPNSFDAQTRGRVDGELGENPQNVPGELNQFEVDWVARQTSASLDDNRLIFSNRFQLAAYDFNSGQWLWRFGLGGEQGPAHEWNVVPMRPVVTPSHIYVRRLHKQGPVLSCVESASGKPVWSAKIESDRQIISDPLLIQDQLFTLNATRVEQDYVLTLTSYDRATGSVVAEKPLTALRDTWLQHRSCQVLALDDSLIACVAGTVLCCDLDGQLRWLRRQTWIPANLDRSWVAQAQSPPIAREGRLYVMQPGVRALVCLDAESGRLIWQRVLPDAQSMSLSGRRLILRTRGGVTALSAEKGERLWQTELPRMFDGQLISDSGPFIFALAEQVKGENNWQPVLVWVDPATGNEIGRIALDSLKHERPKLGPLLFQGGKIWAYFGRGEQDANREIVQLTPK